MGLTEFSAAQALNAQLGQGGYMHLDQAGGSGGGAGGIPIGGGGIPIPSIGGGGGIGPPIGGGGGGGGISCIGGCFNTSSQLI